MVIVNIVVRDFVGTYGFCVSADGDPKLPEHQGGDCSCGNASDRLASGRTPAAAIVAYAVFYCVRVIRMAGTEKVSNIPVIFRPVILVADKEGDRSSGRLSLKYAGKDFHRIRLVSLSRIFTLARFPPVEKILDVLFAQADSGRAAVDHNADSGPVGLSPGGYVKYFSKC